MMVWFLLAVAAADAQVIDIGGRKQLFIDHYLMEMAEGITLRVNPPHQTREKLVVTDAAWERDAHLGSYSTIAQEGGRIRLWYDVRAGERQPGQNPPFMGVAYAESSDGVRFTKPVLRLVERNGSRENNLVMPTNGIEATIGGGSVWRDENPNCPPEQRYKSWSKFYAKKGSGLRGPHRLWTSPDGLKWTLDERMMTGLRAADTQPSWFWEPRVGRYVAFSREWVREKAGFGARMASYNESDDMIHWDGFSIALEPDERDRTAQPAMRINPFQISVRGEDILPPRSVAEAAGRTGDDQVLTPTAPLDFYGPGVFSYEGVYFALIPVFHHWEGTGAQTVPSTSDIQLAMSRDGRHFTRLLPRQPFLTTGMAGAFDSKWIYPLLRPVRMGNELWIYYYGHNVDHASRLDASAKQEEGAISRAVMRVDGFVSADADYEGGWFLSRPLRFTGSRLELNLNTGAGGVAYVEIVDGNGRPLPGFTMAEADALNGNGLHLTASWGGKTDVAALAGKNVRVRVKMRSAKLYALQFVQ